MFMDNLHWTWAERQTKESDLFNFFVELLPVSVCACVKVPGLTESFTAWEISASTKGSKF